MGISPDQLVSGLELYGAKTGNCFRAAIGLEEAGIAYTVRRVDLARGEHRNEPFLALNPAGLVPVLVSRGNPPWVLTQSNAILFHADQLAPGRLLPVGDGEERTRCLEAFFYFIQDVIAVNGGAFQLARRQLPEAAALLTERYLDAIRGSERFLSPAGFMGGSHFSVADIVGFTIVRAVGERLDWQMLPRLREWWERIESRPGVQRGLRAFDAV